MSAISSGVYPRGGFGIKKRRWFGGRSRPIFMEPLVGVPQGVPPPNDGKGVPPPNDGKGVPPPNDGNYVRLTGGVGSALGSGPLQMMRRSQSSSFPFKYDAGYIGYLSDDESVVGGSGDEGEGRGMMSVVHRRRCELLGSDISFSSCMFMMIMVCGLLMLFLFAVSPWGVPPPRRL